MNDVERVRQIFQKKQRKPKSGTVMSVQGGQLVIRTTRGTVLSVAAGEGAYRQGDRVTLSDNIVVDKITTDDGKTIYVV